MFNAFLSLPTVDAGGRVHRMIVSTCNRSDSALIEPIERPDWRTTLGSERNNANRRRTFSRGIPSWSRTVLAGVFRLVLRRRSLAYRPVGL